MAGPGLSVWVLYPDVNTGVRRGHLLSVLRHRVSRYPRPRARRNGERKGTGGKTGAYERDTAWTIGVGQVDTVTCYMLSYPWQTGAARVVATPIVNTNLDQSVTRVFKMFALLSQGADPFLRKRLYFNSRFGYPISLRRLYGVRLLAQGRLHCCLNPRPFGWVRSWSLHYPPSPQQHSWCRSQRTSSGLSSSWDLNVKKWPLKGVCQTSLSLGILGRTV